MNVTRMSKGYRGNLFIVAAPSGGGKTSLVSQLIRDVPDLALSISHTTRKMRPGEVDGENYFFVSPMVFQSMIHANEFIEHAQVFDHWYGTSVQQIEARLAQGIDIVLDIDWQGARQIKQRFVDAVGIFIIPPSLDALTHRLRARQQDDEAVIHGRMLRAQDELTHYTEFDYLIVNDQFNEASQELRAIILANQLRIDRQKVAQGTLLSFLLATR